MLTGARDSGSAGEVLYRLYRGVQWNTSHVLRGSLTLGMIRHRQGADGYESTAGYGPYRWGAASWTYGYERSEGRRGPTPEAAPLRVTEIPLRTFEITREGDHLILEDADRTLRWDYDVPGRRFTLMGRDRRVIRVYERLAP